ncbi:MAG: alpha/beta hydrolase-fold protein [Oscillospiraceae bacterium]|nr:alpha/beta hydrolase-fold protein [Oscillospiraceae bacterium]
MKETVIDNKKVLIYCGENPRYILIQPVDSHDAERLENELKKIKEYRKKKNFIFAAFNVDSWNRDLSPWCAPAVFGDEAFGDGASDTLKYITDSLLPALKSEYGLPDDIKVVLGGYSLAGLFALWAGYETKVYGIAAASPSVWFEGFDKYTDSHRLKAEKVYLSVGNKEEKTRNQTMARVGDRLRALNREYTRALGENTAFEINPGNHFVDTDIRTAKAFAWVIK